MTTTTQTLPAETGGTDITRFNALRHGVLSRYTVLPWESADEYRAVVEALVAEHRPLGPTEEHLVEEMAGILWRMICNPRVEGLPSNHPNALNLNRNLYLLRRRSMVSTLGRWGAAYGAKHIACRHGSADRSRR